MARIKRGFSYLRKHGLKAFCKKAYEKIRLHYGISYRSWQRSHRLTRKQFKLQTRETFSYMPKISVILPLCRTTGKETEDSIKSVQEQSYGNWELILAGGRVESDAAKHESALRTNGQDQRIKYFSGLQQQSMIEGINSAVTVSSGEYIIFLEAGDFLARNALYECVKALNENPETEFLYSDEDKGFGKRKNDAEPCFKPDFNLDLLRSLNYIGHLVAVHRTLWEKAGPLRDGYKGAEGYDFILRCVEQTKNIFHIPKILYHGKREALPEERQREPGNRRNENNPGAREVFESEKKAIADHLKRCGISAVLKPEDWKPENWKPENWKSEKSTPENIGRIHHVVYSRDKEPLVSVIIPNKDAAADLCKCVDSLERNSSYRNLEYIIVENNSREEETFRYYEKLQKENPRVKVHRYNGGFNYSKINNFGVQQARGEYLLLLNNDTELKAPDSIGEMLGICMRRDVGAVGAKLLYFDDTIQHAGVIIGAGGIAGHCFTGLPGDAAGYCKRAACVQDYNAVTAACLMTKRSVFETLGGLREEFEVAFNDIDYCMRIRQQGELVVYTPYAEFYHYESKTRGLDTEPEKKERFMGEIRLFEELWPEILENGDCYYNPNLSYKKADFALGL